MTSDWIRGISLVIFASKQIDEPDLEAVLKLPYVNLYEPIGKWILSQSTTPREEDSHPPNLASLIKALVQKTQSIDSESVEPGPVAEAVAPTAKKAARKTKKAT